MRTFWLTLFAIGAATVLVFGWQDGVPWTAASFVTFFVSRVWRSVIKRPLSVGRSDRSTLRADGASPAYVGRGVQARHADDPIRRTNRFIIVTACGYLATGVFACIAAIVGEGQEWLYVAPCFLIMGALQLALLTSRGH